MAIAEESGESKVYYPTQEFKENAHITSMTQYRNMYKRSVEDPEGFWSEIAQDFFFKKLWSGHFLKYNFDITRPNKSMGEENIQVKWMEGATTNICYNILDRIIEKGMGDRVAYICEGNDPNESARKITYNELKGLVCRLANVYKSKGLKKGDRMAIYMPNTVELVVAMLAAARIGAVHTVVFAGFSATALAERIVDSRSKILVTADGVYRGAKFIPLKEIADDAVAKCRALKHYMNCVIVNHHLKCPVHLPPNTSTTNTPLTSKSNGISHLNGHVMSNGSATNGSLSSSLMNGSATLTNGSLTNGSLTNGSMSNGSLTNGSCNKIPTTNGTSKNYPSIPWNPDNDVWWHEALSKMSDECEPVWVDAEDALFIIYSSGSTGKPKGVLHTTGGYMIYSATTFKYVFNYNGGDVFFCTADLGWITGHTVNVYGSLANGATILLFDGTPFHPDASRLWQIVDRHSVNTFYTAPTAIRALMRYGDHFVKQYRRTSLKLLGTAGEPINPEAWKWYYDVVGNGKCPIVDTFWQTETGAPMLTPLPGCTPMKPGSATLPFFGVIPAILNEEGKEMTGPCEGQLVIKTPWPSIARTIDGNHKRYELTYFSPFPGYYCVGDGARRDKDGYYWITGRTDDLLNVSGHLLSTSEVEAALVEHDKVAETAAVSCPHPIKGESIYCFIVLRDGFEFSKELENELREQVRKRIGAIATPEVIHPASSLPKTRSGKIMRRLLRKIARDEDQHEFGDVSTLADESILEELRHTKALYALAS